MKKTTLNRQNDVETKLSDAKLAPSHYMALAAMSTKERSLKASETTSTRILELLNMSEVSHYKDTHVDLNEPLFQVSPSEIIFQKFDACETYEIPLILKNSDKVARHVRITQEESPYFDVIPPKCAGSKVAPGMDTTYVIRFNPNEKKDYAHELICITEREKFSIPVRAIGARAVLDFPDKVNFSTSPVKHTVSKTLLVRNVGNRDSKFVFTATGPFSVTPTNGSLEVSAGIQVTVDFTPTTIGNHNGELAVCYDTGEVVYVSLYGAAVNAHVRLDKSSLTMEKTFIGLMSQRAVTIVNRSDVIVRYQWKPFPTDAMEKDFRTGRINELTREEDDETEVFLRECMADPTLRDRISILSRTFQNRKKSYESDALLFDDDIFAVEPTEGEIWPNADTSVTVFFRPQKATSHTRTAYLDVTGREERLPLKLKGEGVGPIVCFSFDSLDIGKVFVSSAHAYEVIVENKGDIDAEYSLLPMGSLFGPHFQFSPSQGVLSPGSLQSIEIAFRSSILGEFSEDFLWEIKGAPEPLRLNIRGSVIGPTFHFTAAHLDFGIVSYGFPKTEEVTLINTSEISMSYALRVPGFASEFQTTPSQGNLNPGERQKIQVDFIPEQVTVYDTALTVDVDGVGDDVLSLPLVAQSVVPTIDVRTPIVDYRRCFLGYPYEQSVELVNESDLPAKYELIPQSHDLPQLLYFTSKPRGIIDARSSYLVPLTIEPCMLEAISAVALFRIAGSMDQPLEIELKAIGEGPVVSVKPRELDWGRCPVLTPLTKKIRLSNEALIPAKFKCSMARERTVFRVSPQSGEISPESIITLEVTAFVNDAQRFSDKLTVSIAYGVCHTVHLSALGQGTTIVADPPMVPSFDLGPHFSTRPCSQIFTLRNAGRRHQALSWATLGFSTIRAKKYLKQNRPLPPELQKPVFAIVPNKMELEPGQEATVEIRGHSDVAKSVRETLVCHAIIGKNPMKEKIMEVALSAEFISPLLRFSAEELHFKVLQVPSSLLQIRHETLDVVNVSSLSVTAQLHCPHPFQLLSREKASSDHELFLNVGESTALSVFFNPGSPGDRLSHVDECALTVTYKEHPHEDRILLKGEVHFPNLDFESMIVDFGCILNDTEMIRSVTATNQSPLTVTYRWSFVEFVDDDDVEQDEGVDLQSADEETDSARESKDGSETSLQPTDKDTRLSKKQSPSIEQIFDILPLYGTVRPGESQQFLFSFFGHADLAREAIVQCDVTGGPSYELKLRGEAALVCYEFDRTTIECGKLIYDQETSQSLSLFNTGKVPLDFHVVDATESGDGVVVVDPQNGDVEPGGRREIQLKFVPAFPGRFTRTFGVRVAHFKPTTITVAGEGVFPHVLLALPRVVDPDGARAAHETTAKENVANDDDDRNRIQIEKEIDRLVVRDDAVGKQRRHARPTHGGGGGGGVTKRKTRPHLPDYVLDFGHVVVGQEKTLSVRATNVGDFPVTFGAEKSGLVDVTARGFDVTLKPVRQLPANEWEEFNVRFATKTSDDLGQVAGYLPILVSGGPSLGIWFRANKTMPEMEISADEIDFGDVDVGECMIVTVQLFNNKPIDCEWKSVVPEMTKKRKAERFLPRHLQRKVKEKLKPKHFELIPSSGLLKPGQRAYIQAKFLPSEETLYGQKIDLIVTRSTCRHMLRLTGKGREPRVVFDSSVVEFGPVLPHSNGQEIDVTVSNPTANAVEIYSLDFDKRYTEEDDILRATQGYDIYNTLLLPPRSAGDPLPPEIVDECAQERKGETDELKEEAEEKSSRPDSAESRDATNAASAMELALGESTVEVGELEFTPVARAIARYLGIDYSSEGKAALMRRGVAVIVHGPSLSGKTTQATALATAYGAALLKVDDVLNDAIVAGSTTAALQAKEICRESAAQQAKAAEEAEAFVAGANADLAKSRRTSQSSGKFLLPNVGGGEAAVASTSSMSATSKTSIQIDIQPPAPVGDSTDADADEQILPTVLPEELIVEILDQRMQQADCSRGVIIDGLESQFTSGLVSTASIVLRAFENRKWIFFVQLNVSLNRTLERQEAKQKAEAAEREKRGAKEEEVDVDLSEDEYEALSEEQRDEYDRRKLAARKKKIRERIEKEEQERKEQERLQALLEEKRLEEERLNKKGKRRRDKEKEKEKDRGPGKSSPTASTDRLKQAAAAAADASRSRPPSGRIREQSQLQQPVPVTLDRADSQASNLSEGPKRRRSALRRAPSVSSTGLSNELSKQSSQECGNPVIQKYTEYESSLKLIHTLLEQWDRTTGTMFKLARGQLPGIAEGGDQSDTSSPRPQAQMALKRGKSRRDKEVLTVPSVAESPSGIDVSGVDGGEAAKESERRDDLGVPCFQFDAGTTKSEQLTNDLMSSGLPSLDDILEGLGLGPDGPPIPPPARFAVIPYPVRRPPPVGSSHYAFVATSPDDPNIGEEDRGKTQESEQDSQLWDKESKKSSAHTRSTVTVDEDRSSRLSKRLPQTTKQSAKKTVKSVAATPPQSASKDVIRTISPVAEDSVVQPKTTLLGSFRWVIPAGGSTTLRIRFQSFELGQFDQTLNFELLGTRRAYQLYCRGLCAFPQISREPRIVFPSRKKTRKEDEIVHKKYIMDTETFEFGPLHVGKSKEKYKEKEQRYPENMETLTIKSHSPQVCELTFCFRDDAKGDTYLLDPPEMVVQPGESRPLRVWAFPRTPGFFKDAIVCCIKENPEPVLFPVTCHGCRAELELDKKTLQFDKTLLLREDTKTLYIRNHGLVPAGWQLGGLETLGDDFTFSHEHGVVEPKSEFALKVQFRAAKQTIVNKKAIRIEVFDTQHVLGVIQLETVYIYAEAYDVALDISFPKGADGGLDFGCIRVAEEAKQVLSIRNKGRYEISYSFLYHGGNTDLPADKLNSIFSVKPSSGRLQVNEKPQQVQVEFHPLSGREITVKDQALLKCNVIEPKLGKDGQVIASIPIRLSARSVFSRYSIHPAHDINFGPMVVGSRKQRFLTIENHGEFDFRYAVLKLSAAQARFGKGPITKRARSRDGSGRTSQQIMRGSKKADSLRQDVLGQQRLVLGMFAIYPGMGIVQPGSSQTINVDCIAETPGKCEELVSIDVSDRNPKDHREGISYKLMAESCIPGINITDAASIFEEHRVVRHLSVLGQLQQKRQANGSGVYSEEEKKFYFNTVIVGHRAKARFKIINPYKVPCDVTFSVKAQYKSRLGDVFDVDPNKASIPAHGHSFSTVTFSPPSMQTFVAHFEALLDAGPLSGAASRARSLAFEIVGEGNLPHVAVVRPALRNKKSLPLIVFRRLLVGRRQTMPLALRNEGSIPATVVVKWTDADEAFTVCRVRDDEEEEEEEEEEDDGREAEETTALRTATVKIEVGKTANFVVVFHPKKVRQYRSQLQLQIVDNQFENTSVHLVGEGFQDDVTIGDIVGGEIDENDEETAATSSGDDVSAIRENHLQFGPCSVGELRQISFTLTNHATQSLRFAWPSGVVDPSVTFSPSRGHLRPHSSKDVVATFRANAPKQLDGMKTNLHISKIVHNQPLSQVGDWDDRMKSVKWVPLDLFVSDQADRALAAGESATDLAVATAAASVPEAGQRPPLRRKLIETEPEPEHAVVDDSNREIDLRVSVICDFAEYKCETTNVKFRDTLMFQTRAYSFALTNQAKVFFTYRWSVLTADDREIALTSRPGTALGYRSVAVDETGSFVASDGDEVEPFSIEPVDGILKAGETQTFTIRFSPLDAVDFERRLKCTIPNLSPRLEPLVVAVSGRSLMPYCHFELENSDYLTSGRRNPDMRGASGLPGSSVDPNTRVIEFFSCGVNNKIIRRFFIVNPTSNGYDFNWSTYSKQPRPQFKCLTPQGHVAGGKKTEVVFEFVGDCLDQLESFWVFSIPRHSISVSFLLVGHVSEPAVTMDRSSVNFRSMLIGRTSRDVVNLINNESTPFHFAVNPASCHVDKQSARLVVEPMSGVVQPTSTFPITVTFGPLRKQEYNFNVQCSVRRKPTPISLNVKGEGYAVHAALVCEQAGSGGGSTQVELLPESKTNFVDFGGVQVNERAVRQIAVVNLGRFNFDFDWTTSEKCQRRGGSQSDGNVITVKPASGTVASNNRTKCEVAFCPSKKLTLDGCVITCKIPHGPTFPITVLGRGTLPSLSLSFTKRNFGPCFLNRPGMTQSKETLEIVNNEKKDVSLCCLYSSSAHLDVQFSPCVLAPAQTTVAVFSFHPNEPGKYRDLVPFVVNGLSRVNVEIQGEGTAMKVEVAKSSQRHVRFGALRVGQSKVEVVELINRSARDVKFRVSVVSSSIPAGVVTVTPDTEIELSAKGGTAKVEVKFHSTVRVKHFVQEVTMESVHVGLSHPLFVVSGSCQGIEFSLDSDHLPFGAVVVGSSSSRKLIMSNLGDIGAHFRWDNEKFGPDFSISPAEGYLAPSMEAPFEVAFHPKSTNYDIRKDKIACDVWIVEKKKNGGEIVTRCDPLQLTLTGTAISQQQSGKDQIIQFSTHVRMKETRAIPLSNRTTQPWTNIQPVIDGEFWSGPETITVNSGSTCQYELTYRPLTMTTEQKKHTGSIFFPLPDGNGSLYSLLGLADPPKPSGNISRDVPCKTAYTQLLTVTNWLRRPQRFKATIEILKPDKPDPTTTVKGLEYIDVPAKAKKEYQLHFYAHKEGQINAKVTFKNEQSGEYAYYFVAFKSTPPEVIATISISTAVRQMASRQVSVRNPLQTPVTFQTNCNVSDISLPSNFTVPAQSEGSFTFEYLPLKSGDVQGRLILTSSELGLYQYDLQLTSTRGGSERPVHFTVGLGASLTQVCRFVCFAKQKADFICKVDHADFHVDRNLSSAAASAGGTEVGVEVTFEPGRLGDSKGQLTVTSPVAGEYVIPLYGHCVAPKPQGPFTVRAGSSYSIPFKNVFARTAAFAYTVDNPAFVVKFNETIKSRKTHNMIVSYEPSEEASKTSGTAMAKLTVTCSRSAAGGAGNIQWVYYLKGIVPY